MLADQCPVANAARHVFFVYWTLGTRVTMQHLLLPGYVAYPLQFLLWWLAILIDGYVVHPLQCSRREVELELARREPMAAGSGVTQLFWLRWFCCAGRSLLRLS
jgi:hypothetical protein